jgi:two-component system sensor histidine kinase LytS
MLNGEAIGTLKFYNTKETEIKQADIELVIGLASLFSTQLELSKLDEQAKRLAQSELKALQAQINPHFLFNALNTINALIRINPEDARKQLTHLADYFRHNLQFIEDRVSLGKELKQIQSYLEIEKARYRDNLTVEYDIRADLNHMIPPLVIQPLVENSIKHGIFKMKESGKIKIILEENAHNLSIVVSDDGVGIEAQLIPKLLNGQFNCESVGIFNTHRRLQVAYGSDNGLVIQNLKSGGTSVTISIPKLEVTNVKSRYN